INSKRTGLINGIQSGNRWGLKGSEDLGDGLRAVFVLESGFNLGDGNSAQGGRLFGRQATLGLAGDSWGQLDFGRQTNITSKYLSAIADPFGGGFDQANIGGAFTSANTVRYDNMVMYQTPNFSGFQFGVGYSFN
ncbi:porin, partial [Alcaligenes pakistanensis]